MQQLQKHNIVKRNSFSLSGLTPAKQLTGIIRPEMFFGW
jgi:hypothetical protein